MIVEGISLNAETRGHGVWITAFAGTTATMQLGNRRYNI
jgi:hypothetical protein